MDEKRKKPIGLAFRKLDAADEHAGHLWHELNLDSAEANDPNNYQYRARAIIEYMREALSILRENVPGEWQLCPYQDCCWGCGCDGEGYYFCPHCGRVFYCRHSDGDYEDLVLSRVENGSIRITRDVDLTIKSAVDFGPTWATPQDNTDEVE